MKKIVSLLLLYILIIFSSIQSFKAVSLEYFNFTFENRFGSEVTINIQGFGEKDEIDEYKNYIEETLDFYHGITNNKENMGISGSIYDINQNSGSKIEISEELYAILSDALEYKRVTKGNFDITIGTIVDVWKDAIVKNKWKEIKESDFLTLLENVATEVEKLEKITTDRLQISSDSGHYYAQIENGVKLDLGAIAKGYVTQVIRDYLNSNNVNKYIINSGSSSIFIGDTDGDDGISMGLIDPTSIGLFPDNYGTIKGLKKVGVASSGTEQQFFTYKGERYHHIISPVSFSPVHSYYSLTLLGEDAGMLDALSTAYFSMSKEEIELSLSELNITGMFYNSDGSLWNKLNNKYTFEENLNRKLPSNPVPQPMIGRWIIIGIIGLFSCVAIGVSAFGLYKMHKTNKTIENGSIKEKNINSNKKRDVLSLVIIVVLVLAIFGIFMLWPKRSSDVIYIYHNKDVLVEIDLESKIIIDKSNEQSEYSVEIVGNSIAILEKNTIIATITFDYDTKEAWFIFSDCPGQDCVLSGKSTYVPIICLHNRLVIEFGTK